jgi:hypothetical protein
MVGSESESEFLVRIRILHKNSDYFGFGFGSTTLVPTPFVAMRSLLFFWKISLERGAEKGLIFHHLNQIKGLTKFPANLRYCFHAFVVPTFVAMRSLFFWKISLERGAEKGLIFHLNQIKGLTKFPANLRYCFHAFVVSTFVAMRSLFI